MLKISIDLYYFALGKLLSVSLVVNSTYSQKTSQD